MTASSALARRRAASIIERAATFLGQWSTSDMANPMLLIDVAMNSGFVHRNYPDVAAMDWLSTATPAAVTNARAAGLPVAYIDRLLTRSSPHEVAVPSPAIESATDAALFAALWCDDPPTVAAIAAAAAPFTLVGLVDSGGYDATHAIGAAQLAAENGCDPQPATGGAAPTASEAWAVLRPLIVDREVDDLMLEACGIARYRGLVDAIPAATSRIDDIERAQRTDGAFGRAPGGEADAHTTVWAMRCLAPVASSLVVDSPTWIVR